VDVETLTLITIEFVHDQFTVCLTWKAIAKLWYMDERLIESAIKSCNRCVKCLRTHFWCRLWSPLWIFHLPSLAANALCVPPSYDCDEFGTNAPPPRSHPLISWAGLSRYTWSELTLKQSGDGPNPKLHTSYWPGAGFDLEVCPMGFWLGAGLSGGGLACRGLYTAVLASALLFTNIAIIRTSVRLYKYVLMK